MEKLWAWRYKWNDEQASDTKKKCKKMNKAWQIFINQYTSPLDDNMCFAKQMQEHVNDNVNQHTFLLFIFERRFFFVCAYVEAWFPIGVVDNTVVQSCLNSWTRHVLEFSTQRHGFFIVARIFRQSFPFHIGILQGSSFFLGLALECWCAQPFTFPFILYCLIVSLFCVSF